jgi:hypothetical protein
LGFDPSFFVSGFVILWPAHPLTVGARLATNCCASIAEPIIDPVIRPKTPRISKGSEMKTQKCFRGVIRQGGLF